MADKEDIDERQDPQQGTCARARMRRAFTSRRMRIGVTPDTACPSHPAEVLAENELALIGAESKHGTMLCSGAVRGEATFIEAMEDYVFWLSMTHQGLLSRPPSRRVLAERWRWDIKRVHVLLRAPMYIPRELTRVHMMIEDMGDVPCCANMPFRAVSSWPVGLVYMLATPDWMKVKVGFTSRTVEQRKREHERKHGPLLLIAQREGSIWHERVIQALMWSSHAHGEWFEVGEHYVDEALNKQEFWEHAWDAWRGL